MTLMTVFFGHKTRLFSLLLPVAVSGIASLFTENAIMSAYGVTIFVITVLLLCVGRARKNKNKILTEETADLSQEERTEVVIFIIGPYAEKWFARQSPSAVNLSDHHITWLLATSVPELEHRLERALASASHPLVSLFFPFLPDGHANEASMLIQLSAWRNALLSLKQHPLPGCTLAIYARLSHERLAHDPDHAIWTGNLNLDHEKEVNLPSAFNAILDELETADNGICCYAAQRSAMTYMLFLWMSQGAVSRCLQSLFTSPGPLRLNRVLVADHSYGFSRHGAWSEWLAANYGVLPGLATSLCKPPLPAFSLPQPEKKRMTLSLPLRPARWLPIAGAITLLLACLLMLAAREHGTLLKSITPDQQYIAGLNSVSVTQEIDAILRLHKDKQILLSCRQNSLLDKLFLSPCKKRLISINEFLADYYDRFFSRVILYFPAGRAILHTETQKTLSSLIPVFNQSQTMRFIITGHSDNTGMPDFNKALSLQRALAVRDWISKKTTIPASRFIIQGAADSRPAASNLTEEGRRLNRRVEIKPLPEPSDRALRRNPYE